MTRIISAFPGTGKTYFHTHKGPLATADSDSSHFSWISKGVRHPEFPANYIEHINDLMGKVDYIFVSSHQDVRNALTAAGLPFISAYPSINLKDEYLARFRQRMSPAGFIHLLEENWDAWVRSMSVANPDQIILGRGEFLTGAVKMLEARRTEPLRQPHVQQLRSS